MENDPAAMGKIQKVAVTIHERFKVAICLCLIPKYRAWSLSTPMAVNINYETKRNPAKKEREHWNVSVCVPPSVEFAVAIIVQLLKRASSFRYCF